MIIRIRRRKLERKFTNFFRFIKAIILIFFRL